MREFFSEKLALPIEFLNPLRNVAAGSNIDVNLISRDAHLLGELVGLGLRSGNDCPMELDLRPVSVAKAQAMAARRPFLVMAGIAFLLILAGWHIYFQEAAKIQQAVVERLKPKIAALQNVERQFNTIRAEIKGRQDAISPLTQVVAEREYWIKLIDDVNSRLPARYIWITSMETVTPKQVESAAPAAMLAAAAKGPKVVDATPTPELVIKGLILANPSRIGVVDDFAKALAASPYFSFDPKNKALMPVRATWTDTEWTFDYEIHLPLKKPLAL